MLTQASQINPHSLTFQGISCPKSAEMTTTAVPVLAPAWKKERKCASLHLQPLSNPEKVTRFVLHNTEVQIAFLLSNKDLANHKSEVMLTFAWLIFQNPNSFLSANAKHLPFLSANMESRNST